MKLTDEQTENLTYSLYCTLMEFKKLNTGFTPEYEDIIKCVDNALRTIWAHHYTTDATANIANA